jgi:hypothetical protein
MRLADEGEVFGHFVIPYVDEENIREALSKAVDESMVKPNGIRRARFTSIAGECDLLLHLYTSDFRVVADFQAMVIDYYSLASSWLYAIPYEELGAADPVDGGLEFFIYLRVHRHFYTCYGTHGEEKLHVEVSRLLKDTGGKELSGRVLYSLGWPDLIVHGRLSGNIEHLRRLIISLQFLSFQAVASERSDQPVVETPIFLKTITVIGPPMTSSRDQGSPHAPSRDTMLPVPVLFASNRPGLTVEAVRALRSVLEQSGAAKVTAWAVNGTWDLVVTSRAKKPVSLETFHAAIRKGSKGFASNGIERTQTHLLTSLEADLERLRKQPVTLRPPHRGALLPDRCACGQEDFEELRQLLLRLGHLPRALTRTIFNVLSMFRHTLREASNCCDAVGALRAHAQGLEVLLRRSEYHHELLKQLEMKPATSLSDQALIATEISFINSHLAEWCKRAGRVVREKTSGSAARLFLQVDSIVAQRGAIPKILIIAERIMEDFYSRLPSELPRRVVLRSKRRFAAILEPLGNVTSQPLMGSVSIPIRYAFSLHLVVPQLWHEVGQYVFWAEYTPHLEREISLSSMDPDMGASRSMVYDFEVDFQLRADMFADLLVFCFGFGGSLEKFFLYLGSLTANVAKHDGLHMQSWNRQAVALVQRLCFVAQFTGLQRRASKARTPLAFTRICSKYKDALLGDNAEAQKTVRVIVEVLQSISERAGWPQGFLIPPNLAPVVAKNFRSQVYERCLQDMERLAFAFRNLRLDGTTAELKRATWKRIQAGELVDLRSGDDLLAAYRDFYLEEMDAQLAGSAKQRRDGQFRKMATLGRSALLHIYRSERGAV